MTKEEELQKSLSETIDYYEKYVSELNHQSVMVYAAARNYEDKCKLLQNKLALTEKALELACDKIEHIFESDYSTAWFYAEDNKTIIERDKFEDYFKTKAREMMRSE